MEFNDISEVVRGLIRPPYNSLPFWEAVVGVINFESVEMLRVIPQPLAFWEAFWIEGSYPFKKMIP